MVRVAIIGGGPRGLSVLERLIASLATPDQDATRKSGIEIVVVDPQWPGPGQVWRRDQSPLVLMNTLAGSCTIFTDASVKIDGPVVPGPNLAHWARTTAQGLAVPDAVKQLALSLADDSFAPRILYGHYLHWAFAEIVHSAPTGVTVRHVRAEARDMERGAEGWQVTLSNGDALVRVTSVILALGHPLTRPQAARQISAPLHIRPGNATDADLSQIVPGETVALRGLGLCAFDYIALLTEGRSGRFLPSPDGGQAYLTSGEEPKLLVGSRRGLPYRGRGASAAERYRPTVLIPAVTEELARRPSFDFEVDLWPLIAAEFQAAGGSGDGLALLERWSNPFGERVFTDHAALRTAVVAHLETDIADSQDPASPFRRIQGAMRLARSTIREQLSLRQVTARSHGPMLERIRDLLDFSISGPPAHRIAQLLSLEAAGVVEFAGPGMTVIRDGSGYRVTSTRVGQFERQAQALIDAWLPPSEIPDPDGLVARQVARGEFSFKSPLTDGAALAVDPTTLAVLDRNQKPVGFCFALGQVIAPQEWVPVIAPLSGTNSRFLRMTDRVARAALDEIGRCGAPRLCVSKEDDLRHAN